MVVQIVKSFERKDELNKQIKSAVQFIKDFYSELGYEIYSVNSILRRVGDKKMIEYEPLLKSGFQPRNLTVGEKYDLNLDKWSKYRFLGFRGKGKGKLIPLAARKCAIPPELLKETETGMFLIEDEKMAIQIQMMVDSLFQSNVTLYSSSSIGSVGMHDILLFLEYLLLKGGYPINVPSLSQTSCGNPVYQFYVQLPPFCPTLHKAKEGIRLIRQGFLPYETFSGFWSPFPPNSTIDEIKHRIRWFQTIAVISYQTLCKKYSYLAPLIYDVYVDSLYQINAPLATLTQHNEYKKLLEHNFGAYPLDFWTPISYHSIKDLLVKRFAYEKLAEIVFVPDNEFIMVYNKDAFLPIEDKELEREQKELEFWVKRQGSLKSPSGEERCLENCGLERSLCCIDRGNQRIEPIDLEEELLEISLEEEEKLQRMEWGLKGYFSIGGVLKGLFQDPPLPPSLSEYKGERGSKLVDKKVEGNLLLYLIQTEDGREFPVLNSLSSLPGNGREEETLEVWNQGDLLTPWGRAMLEHGMETVSLKPELCEGGKCLLTS